MNEKGYEYTHITSGVFDSDLIAQLEQPLLTGVERGELFTVRNELLPGL